MELRPGYKQTEVGVIPEDWELHDFDALGNVIDGDRGTHYPSADEFSDSGYCLFLNAGNVTNEGFKFIECAFITREKDALLNKGKLKRNDIVLTTRGTVGNFAYYDRAVPYEDIRINSGMAILRNESSSLDTAFLYVFLQSHLVHFQIERLSFGSAQPQLTVKGISNFRVVVPPLPEQRAIAKALGDVDALLGALTQLIAKKRDLKQAAMQQLLTGQQRLPGFSGEWEVKRFGDLFQFLNTANNPHADLSEFGDVGYIHYGDIHTSVAVFLDCVSEVLPLIAKAKVANIPLLQDGDLVMADASEDYEGIGKCVEIRNATGRRIVAGLHTFLLRGNGNLLADGFKGYLQFIPSVKAALVRFATGISVYGISKNNVRSIEVLLPSIEGQTAIATILSDMDAELAALEAQLAKTRGLKQGMMQELLTGKTRLPKTTHRSILGIS